MRKDFTFTNFLLLFFSTIFSAFLISTVFDYWGVVDLFALPSADAEILSDPNSINIVYFIFFQVTDYFKFLALDLFLLTGVYDLQEIFKYLVLIILLAAVVVYFVKSGLYELTAIVMCVGVLIISESIVPGVVKGDVDKAFVAFNSEHTIDVDFRKLIREHDYQNLDAAFSRIEDKFSAGVISAGEYNSLYEKFGATTSSEIEALNDWVKNSSSPEFALAARAKTYYDLAWKVRGSAFSSKTSTAQFDGMDKYFNLATEDLKQSMKITDGILYAHITLVGIAGVNRSALDAEAIYAKGLQKFPNSYLYAYFYMDKIQPKWGGSYLQMREVARSYRDHYSENPLLVTLSGLELVGRGDIENRNEDYDAAIKNYKRALLYGFRQSILDDIFYAYKETKEYDMAAEIMSLCISSFNDNASCYFNRAQVYTLAKDWDKAKLDLVEISRSELESAWKNQTTGWMYETLQMYDQAGKHFMLASDMDNEDVYSLKRIYSMSYYKRISLEDALPYMKRWTEIEPEKSGPWLKYADTLEDINPLESIPLYKKYLSLIEHGDEKNKQSIDYASKQVIELTAKYADKE